MHGIFFTGCSAVIGFPGKPADVYTCIRAFITRTPVYPE